MDKKLIPYHWYKYFPSYFDLSDVIKHSIRTSFSDRQDIIHRPFSYFSPSDTKVIILDSSPSVPLTNGLAYSFDTSFEAGLQNDGLVLNDPGLESLAQQGVLLLNARPFKEPEAKGIGWNLVVQFFLQKFSRDYSGRIYMLFGSGLSQYEKYIAQKGNLIIIEKEPSRFQDANDWLERRGKHPINWEKDNGK